MRKIKFKLWHKGLKKFFTTYYSDQISMMPDGNIFWMGECETDNFILLQYTGLKDENGRDIFEGDIVRHATWGDVYEVIFEDGGFHVLNSYDFQTINEYPLEVIGNIYENPELLEGENETD